MQRIPNNLFLRRFILTAHSISLAISMVQIIVYTIRIFQDNPIYTIPWSTAIFIFISGLLSKIVMYKQKEGQEWNGPVGSLVMNLIASVYFATTQDPTLLPLMALSLSHALVRIFEGLLVYRAFSKANNE